MVSISEAVSSRSIPADAGDEAYNTIGKPHGLKDIGVQVDHESREYGMQEDG